MALSTKIEEMGGGWGGRKHEHGILVYCYSKVQMFESPMVSCSSIL